MSKQAMELALEALNSLFPAMLDGEDVCKLRADAIAALQEAIKTQSEPYGYVWFDKHMEHRFSRMVPKHEFFMDLKPLFTSAPTIPEGWRLVPEEPTPKMLAAAGGHIFKDTYKAMLAAAPCQGEKP